MKEIKSFRTPPRIISLSENMRFAESNIYVKEFMYELATERFSQVMWVMQEIFFYGVERRPARFLISKYERTGETEIKMIQEKIAKNVNSAREVVARLWKRFFKEGLITMDFGCIHLCDIVVLKKLYKFFAICDSVTAFRLFSLYNTVLQNYKAFCILILFPEVL